MFEQTFLEGSGVTRRPWTVLAAFAGQIIGKILGDQRGRVEGCTYGAECTGHQGRVPRFYVVTMSFLCSALLSWERAME